MIAFVFPCAWGRREGRDGKNNVWSDGTLLSVNTGQGMRFLAWQDDKILLTGGWLSVRNDFVFECWQSVSLGASGVNMWRRRVLDEHL